MIFNSFYSAFELYPSRKGASTHIDHIVNALSNAFSPTLVCCIDSGEIPPSDPRIHYARFNQIIPHYLDRGREFSSFVNGILKSAPPFGIAQFRDIWSGLPVIKSAKAHVKVFEVNGLPSVELPYRYPDLGSDTLRKLRTVEMYCLEGSDLVICPSKIIRNFLKSLGIQDEKIHVFSNGAVIPQLTYKLDSLPQRYITYFGALQHWQGLDVLIKAFNFLKDYNDIELVICSSQREKFSQPYLNLVGQLGLDCKIKWYYLLGKDELNSVIQNSLFTVAPLRETKRNTVQGCSPVKIFESMANGKAVIASDLPVVREIITDGIDGKLVRPDRPSELARAIRMLVDYPELTNNLGENARKTIIKKYQWDQIEKRLNDFYHLSLVIRN